MSPRKIKFLKMNVNKFQGKRLFIEFRNEFGIDVKYLEFMEILRKNHIKRRRPKGEVYMDKVRKELKEEVSSSVCILCQSKIASGNDDLCADCYKSTGG